MKPESIYLAFVWHQHQPYYQDLSNGNMLMPWVRLHHSRTIRHGGEVERLSIHRRRQPRSLVLKQMKAYEAGRLG